MNCFFDTSVLIQFYVEQKGSKKVSSIIEKSDLIYLSDITYLECISTIRRLNFEKEISDSDYTSLKKRITEEFIGYNIIPFSKDLQNISVKLIDQFQLKAADSIQLASALTVKSDIVHFIATDQKLLSSALKMKLSIINPYGKD